MVFLLRSSNVNQMVFSEAAYDPKTESLQDTHNCIYLLFFAYILFLEISDLFILLTSLSFAFHSVSIVDCKWIMNVFSLLYLQH